MSDFDSIFASILARIKEGDYDEKNPLPVGEKPGMEQLKFSLDELRKYPECTEEKIFRLMNEWGKRQDILARSKKHHR